MENLSIEAGRYTPEILFDSEKHHLKIVGKSFPENTAEFYNPVFQWLKEYLELVEDETINIDVHLSYFNSSSSKVLMELFDLCDESAAKQKNLTINWLYNAEDDIFEEYGEEFREELKSVTFNLVPISD